MSDEPPFSTSAADLAAYLAGRLCHDLMSPASAVVSGIDLLDDPGAQDMRDEALGLITASGRKLADMLVFCRVAYGASASAEAFEAEDLARLVQGAFAHMRADLLWQVARGPVAKPVARAMLNMAQIVGAALITGGAVRVAVTSAAGASEIEIAGEGPRVRLRDEVRAGLEGRGFGAALPGHWVQGYYVHRIVGDAGGQLSSDVADGRIVLRATIPG